METETSQETRSGRSRFGKGLFIVGVILEIMLFVLGGLVEVVSAFSNNLNFMTAYSTNLPFFVALGVSMIFIGFIAWLWPEGPSEEFLWTVKLGPAAGKTH